MVPGFVLSPVELEDCVLENLLVWIQGEGILIKNRIEIGLALEIVSAD